ncbi:MAG: response regulator transcription factor [Firmicutes bacterium]|nr:response regulator transcription factor [Bacillota bacterium]
MMEKCKCLLIEDDPTIQSLFALLLKDEYVLEISATGQAGLKMDLIKNPDFIILDLGLPDIDGMQVIAEVRKYSQKPIIVVTARDEDQEKVTALDLGADDYLTKPFSIEEMLARLRVIKRRLKSNLLNGTSFTDGRLRISYESCQVTVDDKEVHLTPTEYRLLVYLSRNAGKVITYKMLLSELRSGVTPELMDYDMGSLRVYMASLRKKIEPNISKPSYIITHLGIGYRLAYHDENDND